nr:MAG TPA: hypothetical protein [Caudoviricetes sp.]
MQSAVLHFQDKVSMKPALCSSALPFTPYWASLIQLRVARYAKGSPY